MGTVLKSRVIPVMLWKDFGLVKGRQFDHGRRVGAVLPAIRVYNARDVDELVLLDVAASLSGSSPRFDEIASFAKECNVPLAVGGGFRSEHDFENALRAGADKVVLNTSTYSDPGLVERASRRFGSQCVVVSIDYRMTDGRATCTSHAGTVSESYSVVEWASRIQDLGAGELLLTSCERDGMMNGYDNETIATVADVVDLPIIASGGAGRVEHCGSVIQEGHADAVAVGSLFHFTETTPRAIKEHLRQQGVPVRLGESR